MQLERLGADVDSVGSVDLFDKDSLFEALKDPKLLSRGRLVWQAIGLFPYSAVLRMDHLSGLVKNDRNSHYKMQSDALLQVMSECHSWEKFAHQLFHNFDDDVQFILFNLSRLVEMDMANLC